MTYKKVLITGASTGIGRQLALEFGKCGASIWALARSADKLNNLVEEIKAHGGTCTALVGDATDESVFLSLLAQAEQESGGIDLVIANAGWGGKMTYPGKQNINVLNQTIDLNFKAAAQTLEYFASHMAERKHGHLVGITSIAGFRGLPGSAAYSSTKAALITYLESLRFSMRPFGVKVTDIRPGFVKTPMTSKNQYPMPFLLDIDIASHKIYRAILKGRKRFTFPWQMALFGRFLNVLPGWIYDWLGKLTGGKKAIRGLEGKRDSN